MPLVVPLFFVFEEVVNSWSLSILSRQLRILWTVAIFLLCHVLPSLISASLCHTQNPSDCWSSFLLFSASFPVLLCSFGTETKIAWLFLKAAISAIASPGAVSFCPFMHIDTVRCGVGYSTWCFHECFQVKSRIRVLKTMSADCS